MRKIYKYIMNFLYNEPELVNSPGDLSRGVKVIGKNGTVHNLRAFKRLLKYPLVLLSIPIILFTVIKRAFYSRSLLFKSMEPGIFTVSFGNINLGGSGKTPFSYTIAEYLYGLNLKPCIVSRGYKGRLKKKPM